jgi:CubicO group peptidase (beta-lactamase class C family)
MTTQLHDRLGEVLQTGQVGGLHGVAAVRVAPLGIGRFEWTAGADGVPSAASGLRLAPRDLARIGELVLADGVWAGQPIVPAGWIQTMLQPRLRTTWGGQYGYQWYIDSIESHRLVAGMGNGGQRLFVLPDLDLTVAVTAGNYDDADQGKTPQTVLERVILPAVA